MVICLCGVGVGVRVWVLGDGLVGGVPQNVAVFFIPQPAVPRIRVTNRAQKHTHTHTCMSPPRTTVVNELGPEAGTALAKAVEVNSSLAHLNLECKSPNPM